MRGRLTQFAIAALVAGVVVLGTGGGASASSEVGDPGSTNRAYLIAAAMAVIGVALAVLTVWFWRSTRPDHRALGPLEVMGERKWRNADPIARMRYLDAARPEGAGAIGRLGRLGPPMTPAIDLRAKERMEPESFDDLAADEPVQPDVASDGVAAGAIPQARVDELEQLLAGLGIDPLPYVHDGRGSQPPTDGVGSSDETRAEERPPDLDRLLHPTDG